jgi:hypothetical protein
MNLDDNKSKTAMKDVRSPWDVSNESSGDSKPSEERVTVLEAGDDADNGRPPSLASSSVSGETLADTSEREESNVGNDDGLRLNDASDIPSPDRKPEGLPAGQEGSIVSAGDSSASDAKPKKRAVSFSHIEIREFPPILGDSPSVTEGPPLALGTECISHFVQSVDEYERRRGPRVDDPEDLRTEGFYRRTVLKWGYGYSSKEICAVEKEVEKHRRQLERTKKRFIRQKRTELLLAKAKRNLKRVFLGKDSQETAHHDNIIIDNYP